MVTDSGRRQDEAVANAIRWLRRAYRLGAIVDGLATVGMIFPGRLWTAGFRAPFDRNRPEFRLPDAGGGTAHGGVDDSAPVGSTASRSNARTSSP